MDDGFVRGRSDSLNPFFLGIRPSRNPRYVLIPLPYDAHSTSPGSRLAPKAILEASQYMELYDEIADNDLENLAYDLAPAVSPRRREAARSYLDRVRSAASRAYRRSAIPIGIGGEHTLIVPLVESLVEKRRARDFSVVIFDAHSDLRDTHEGSKWSHACSTRRIVEMGLDTTVIGLRSLLPEHRRAGARLIFPGDLRAGQWRKMLSGLKRNLYISIDLDVLDLGIMPAATNPEPGGLSWWEFTDVLVELFRGRRFLAGDVVELCPPRGPSYAAITAARVLVRLIALAEKCRRTEPARTA